MGCVRCKALAVKVAELQAKVDSFRNSRAAYMREYRKNLKKKNPVAAPSGASFRLPAPRPPAPAPVPQPLPYVQEELPQDANLADDDNLGEGRWV